ncbi:TetR/AcrR family transcriptional regulator [Jhaorihella thermophila]|uniref:TetR/AcrR family transcriptional regulator, regulator of autoinduction and epiphytic fitness n=1 Tax=Jhaorihella thermophila TaxID=488547 RepID=A0A1H5UET4_9RHOB|nr:TetR/AcrR family transcriptional regulator [Jhaorihella thermophila]SEF73544.1 TetR/AcrR family transcriptional regulator, regulator of autoinduction and epiphytic fitness [Jhaorihella thermophila]
MQMAPSSPRGRRRAAGTDPAKRAQILTGAARVFMRDGYETANVGAIAAEAGVSKGTLYVYFDDKLDLFVAVIHAIRDKFFGELEAELARPGPLPDRLRRFGRLMVRIVTSDDVIRTHRVMLGALEKAPELGAEFAEGMAKGQSILCAALQAAIDTGQLRIGDVDLACNQFFELCQAGLFRKRLLGVMVDEPSGEEIARLVDSAVDMFLDHYGTPRSRD